MSQAEHYEVYQRDLHVHRILPNSPYREDDTITLCHACHGKKKGKAELDRFELWFNLYDPCSVRLLTALVNEARASGKTVSSLVDDILEAGLASMGRMPPRERG